MKRFPILFLITTLFLVGLACNAAGGSPPPVEIDQDEIVRQAVATIQAQQSTVEVDTTLTADVPVSGALEERLIELYEMVNPSVVFIITENATFELGSGSGFVYDDQGHIITNNHVVAAGDTYEVVFASGERRRAELTGADVDSDLAVVKVEELPEEVESLPLAVFDEIRVGQFVVAIGNPFGEQGSISLGIVSGLGRSLRSQRPTESLGRYSLPGVIQTDAPINPGNSGGPLLNLDGEVIGVNSAIRSTTGFNSGVGFSIPIAAVKRIVPTLIAEGAYTYPYIGITAPSMELDLDAAEFLGLPQAQGVYVTGVTGPAEEAGLVPAPNGSQPGGDLIVGIDGQEVGEFHDLISYLVFETEVGQTVELAVLRDGEELTIPVTLGERP